MVLLGHVQLTPSGRPVLGPGEYEVTTLDKVDLEFEGVGGLPDHLDQAYKGGYVVLSNSRLMWIPATAQQQGAARARACSLPVPGLVSWSRKSQLALTGMKLRVALTCCVDAAGQVVTAPAGVRHESLMLRCRGDAPDALLSQLDLLAKAPQAPAPGLSTTSPRPVGPTPSAGQQQQQQQQQAQHLQSMPAAAGLSYGGAGQPYGAGGPAAAAGPGPGPSASQAAAVPPVNTGMLQQMVEMGFPYWRSARALAATHSSGVQAAVDYLLEMGDHLPGADTPFDLNHPPAAAAPPAQQQVGSGYGSGYGRPPAPPYQTIGQPQAQALQPPASFPVGRVGPLTAGLQAMQVRPPPAPSAAPGGGAAGSQAMGALLGQALMTGQLHQQQQQLQQQQYGGYQLRPGQQGYAGYAQGGPGVGGQSSDGTSWGGSTSQLYDPGSEWGSAAGSTGGAAQPANTFSNPLLEQQLAAYGQAGGAAGGEGGPHAGWPPGGAGAPIPGAASTGGGGAPGPSSHSAGLAVGVSGLMRREAARSSEAGRALDTAFQDLRALMGMAADMVKLAERFRTVAAVQSEVLGGSDDVLDADTAAQLVALGIASPVTRETAGSRYQVELSKQLADWLLGAQLQPPGPGPLARAGGLMPLTDVYCLFNRARGSELVSPDDLLAACKLLGQVGSQIGLRPLSSGLLSVQGPEFSDERVCARIAALVEPSSTADPSLPVVPGLGPAVSASDVARCLACSTSLAAEYLGLAESRGLVCRDDGPQGLRFFRNFFTNTGLTAQLMC